MRVPIISKGFFREFLPVFKSKRFEGQHLSAEMPEYAKQIVLVKKAGKFMGNSSRKNMLTAD